MPAGSDNAVGKVGQVRGVRGYGRSLLFYEDAERVGKSTL